MRLIDADEIFYDQLLNTGNKEHPLEFAVSKKRIDDMPTIEPKPQWIPVTERLPESGRSVLIAENDTDPDWYAAIGQYKYGRWEWRDDMHTALPPKVIAWMPLPTPFREGGEA